MMVRDFLSPFANSLKRLEAFETPSLDQVMLEWLGIATHVQASLDRDCEESPRYQKWGAAISNRRYASLIH